MNTITLNVERAGVEFLPEIKAKAKAACELLHRGGGTGSDFLGWLRLPSETTADFLEDIKQTAHLLQSECEIVVVIGIGGSYLGARAVIDALSGAIGVIRR